MLVGANFTLGDVIDEEGDADADHFLDYELSGGYFYTKVESVSFLILVFSLSLHSTKKKEFPFPSPLNIDQYIRSVIHSSAVFPTVFTLQSTGWNCCEQMIGVFLCE